MFKRPPGCRKATAANIQLVVPYTKGIRKIKVSLCSTEIQERLEGHARAVGGCSSSGNYSGVVFTWDSAGSNYYLEGLYWPCQLLTCGSCLYWISVSRIPMTPLLDS